MWGTVKSNVNEILYPKGAKCFHFLPVRVQVLFPFSFSYRGSNFKKYGMWVGFTD